VSAVTAGIGDSFIDEQLSSCVRNHIDLSGIQQPFLLLTLTTPCRRCAIHITPAWTSLYYAPEQLAAGAGRFQVLFQRIQHPCPHRLEA
jgi:hypothetical protein